MSSRAPGRVRCTIVSAVGWLLASAAIAAGASAQSAPYDPVRKGAGETRAKLTAMERKPFDWMLLSKLSDWKNGAAPSAQSLDGKVVLLVTYSDWYRPAARALAIARRAAETYSKDGLVVIAAHNPQGWKEASKPEAPAGATMLLAVDAAGDLRKALLSSQDPNFYLIDRSGQLRFADIANESLEEAVKVLIAEKREDAASLNSREAAAMRAQQTAEARTASMNNQADVLRNLPELPFTQPSEEVYKDAKWPAMPETRTSSEKPQPRKITLPSTGWSPAQPEMKGRALVLYFWHPGLPESYEQMQSYADTLQRQYQRDLVVIGVLTDMKKLGDQREDEKLTDEQKAVRNLTPESALKKITDFRASRRFDHTLVVDLPGQVLQSLSQSNYGASSIAVPYMAVVSSDGYSRWWGSAGSPQARGAIDRVLEVDPGVQARRRAEAEYLRTIKKDAEPKPATPAGSTGTK